jgi:DNA-binding beta-propeller fold protein YncE
MKKCISFMMVLAILCWFACVADAQNLLSNPESIEYDFHSNLYFVSNWGDGNIIQINESGQQSIFYSGFPRLAGLYKYGNILYVAANLDPYVGVYGLNTGTGQMVAEIPIPGTGLMNDITSDTSGNLYVTDFYDSKIYKIRLSDYSVSLFIDSGLSYPNGIIFDARYNRLVTACQGNLSYPIKAISLTDLTVSVLVYTYYTGVDGLAFDNEYRLYFSTWQTNCVYRYDSSFANEPELVSDGYNGPADIYINKLSNLLCVPDFYNDTIKFVQLYPSAISEEPIPTKFILAQNYPNPFNNRTIIRYSLPEPAVVTIDIFDILGRKIETLAEGIRPAGENQVTWDAGQRASGIYLYRAALGTILDTKSMILMK